MTRMWFILPKKGFDEESFLFTKARSDEREKHVSNIVYVRGEKEKEILLSVTKIKIAYNALMSHMTYYFDHK